MFTIGKQYLIDEIWDALQVAPAQRGDVWRNGLHEYRGSLYVLCSRFRPPGQFFPHQARLRLGQLYWDGASGSDLEPGAVDAVLRGGTPCHLFFSDDEERGFEYLGGGLCEGLSLGFGSPPSVSWEVDPGDGMLCLRKHCNALRRFCLYGPSGPDGEAMDDSALYEAEEFRSVVDWLDLAAAIDSVEVDTTEFIGACDFCSSARDYESARSKLFSDVVTAMTFFTYIWLAAEQLIKALHLPKVPKALRSGGRDIDRALYYLKCRMADDRDPDRMPAYEQSLERLKQPLSRDPRYRQLVRSLAIEPHMNYWGMGLHIVRRLRNHLFHGAMQLPEPEEWSVTEPHDVELIELSARLALLSIQMVLIALYEERGAQHERFRGVPGVRDAAVRTLRSLHLRAS